MSESLLSDSAPESKVEADEPIDVSDESLSESELLFEDELESSELSVRLRLPFLIDGLSTVCSGSIAGV